VSELKFRRQSAGLVRSGGQSPGNLARWAGPRRVTARSAGGHRTAPMPASCWDVDH